MVASYTFVTPELALNCFCRCSKHTEHCGEIVTTKFAFSSRGDGFGFGGGCNSPRRPVPRVCCEGEIHAAAENRIFKALKLGHPRTRNTFRITTPTAIREVLISGENGARVEIGHSSLMIHADERNPARLDQWMVYKEVSMSCSCQIAMKLTRVNCNAFSQLATSAFAF